MKGNKAVPQKSIVNLRKLKSNKKKLKSRKRTIKMNKKILKSNKRKLKVKERQKTVEHDNLSPYNQLDLSRLYHK